MDFIALTIFPEMFDPFWEHGIIRKAILDQTITGSAINIRDYAEGKHSVTDDRPYGGGCGMVMKPEPIAEALKIASEKSPHAKRILLTPQGRVLDDRLVRSLAELEGLIIVCGRYEGVDQRIAEHYIDYEISVGDYILTGGEIAAMAIIDSVTRMLPGALGSDDSAKTDSFSNNRLKHPQYTRPRTFEGEDVPDVLLSGNHEEIEKWRLEMSLASAFMKKPELLGKKDLTLAEITLLKKWRQTIDKILLSLHRSDALPGDQ